MLVLVDTDTLEVALSEAPLSPLSVWVSYADGVTNTVNRSRASVAGVGPDTVMSAPGAGIARVIRTLSLHNPNATSIGVTVSVASGGGGYTLYEGTIEPNRVLVYGEGGWGISPAPTSAESVSFVPAGGIAATNVQGAIEELDSEKQPLDDDLTGLASDYEASTKTLTANVVKSATSAGGTLQSNSGATCLTFGAGSGQGVTTASGLNVSGALAVATGQTFSTDTAAITGGTVLGLTKAAIGASDVTGSEKLYVNGDGKFSGQVSISGGLSAEGALGISTKSGIVENTDTVASFRKSNSDDSGNSIAALRIGAEAGTFTKGAVFFRRTGSYGQGELGIATRGTSDPVEAVWGDRQLTIGPTYVQVHASSTAITAGTLCINATAPTGSEKLYVNGGVVISGTKVNMANLPTSASGLATGDLWNNGGVINIA